MKRRIICCAVVAMMMAQHATAQTPQRKITIGELFTLVESGSKTLRMQKSGVDVSARGIEEAKSKRLADVGASLQLSYNGNVVMTDRDFGNVKGFSQPHFGNSFALWAQQVVYAGGAIDAGIRLAELQKSMSENAVAQTRNQQRFLALGQYLDLYKLDNGIKVYESNIALTEKLIADINTKQQQGMALKNDVTRYELQMEQLKLGKRKLEDQKRILNHQLCNTLGLEGVMVEPEVDLDRIGDAGIKEADLQNTAAMQSPVIRQSALEMQASDQQLKLAKSEMMPKVALVASENFMGEQLRLPLVWRGFSYAVLCIAFMWCLHEIMSFEHFFQALAVFNVLHMFVGGLVGASLHARGMKYYVGDGFARCSGYIDSVRMSARHADFPAMMESITQGFMAQSIKILFGWTLIAALFFAILMLLWDIPMVRRHVKHIPDWPKVGMGVLRGFHRQQRLKELRRQRRLSQV